MMNPPINEEGDGPMVGLARRYRYSFAWVVVAVTINLILTMGKAAGWW